MKYALTAFLAASILFLGVPGVTFAATRAECQQLGQFFRASSSTCEPFVSSASCQAQGQKLRISTNACIPMNESCSVFDCGIPAPAQPGANVSGTRTIEEQQGDAAAALAREEAARLQAERDAASFRAAQTGQNNDKTATTGEDDSWGMWVVWWAMSIVASMFFFIAQLLLWLSTALMDFVVVTLVLNMGLFVNNQGAMGIREAWMILRDLANIFIIAGFVIVGISTILQVQQYNANKFLSRLIIAALLVNFSYFIAGTIIDASNFIAGQVYTSQVMTQHCTEKIDSQIVHTIPAGGGFSAEFYCSVSQHIAATTKLMSWADVRKAAGAQDHSGRTMYEWFQSFGSAEAWSSGVFGTSAVNKKIAIMGIFGSIFLFVAGFVFFTASILLIGRFVVLILLLVTSPIGIAGSNIPFIDQYASRWWSTLFGQAMFAPVYFVLVAISLKILGSPGAAASGTAAAVPQSGLMGILNTGPIGSVGFADFASGSVSGAINALPLFITFFLAIGFMYAALRIAQMMSESGKEFTGAIYDGLNSRFGGIYGNLYSQWTYGPKKMLSWGYDATIGQVGKVAGRVPIVGQYLGGLTNSIGMAIRPDMKAKPFGASKSFEDLTKETQEYVKSVPNVVGGAIGAVMDPAGTGKAIARGWRKMTESLSMWDQYKMDKDLFKKKPTEMTPEELDRAKRIAQGMKDEDLDKLSFSELQELMPFMTSAQARRVMSRGDLDEKDREELGKKRFALVDDALARGDDDRVRQLMADMDETDHKIYFETHKEAKTNAKLLSLMDTKKFEAVINSDAFDNDDERDAARGARISGIEDHITKLREDLKSGKINKEQFDTGVKRTVGRMSDTEIPKLKVETITSPDVMRNLKLAQLRAHYDAANPEDRAKIRQSFIDHNPSGKGHDDASAHTTLLNRADPTGLVHPPSGGGGGDSRPPAPPSAQGPTQDTAKAEPEVKSPLGDSRDSYRPPGSLSFRRSPPAPPPQPPAPPNPTNIGGTAGETPPDARPNDITN